MPEHQSIDTRDYSDLAYQRYILQGVSRTFALTIPQLPRALETAVGNAYLLCRIADTIEDSQELSPAQKQAFSRLFLRVIQGAAPAEDFVQRLMPVLGQQTPPAERDLIDNTARVVRLTHGLNQCQQAALMRCVSIMLDGMTYFQSLETGSGLPDMASLNSYCYHVAGVVGEMLTELYCDYSPDIRQHRDVLLPLAVSFGQGLQMTNILKDVWNDLDRGACGIPQTLMIKHGIDPDRLAQAQGTEAYGNLLNELLSVAHQHLHDALRYTILLPVRETGLRRFCLWAIGMAVLTLQRLHRNPAYRDSSEVKISRRSLQVTIALCNAFTRWDHVLLGLFRLAGTGLAAAASPRGGEAQPLAIPSDGRLRVAYRLQTESSGDDAGNGAARRMAS